MSNIDILIGSVRRIGRNGPPYEVIGRAAATAGGEAQLRVRVIESDEELDYPVHEILKDPLDD